MEQHYINVAVLPRSLEILLFVLHGVRCGSGALLFFFGIGSLVYYNAFIALYMLGLGLAAALSGTSGLLATKFKSLVTHGGCLATSALTLYLGIINYSITISEGSFLVAKEKQVVLLMCNVILIVLDMMISAMSVGFQALVLYISTKKN
ncbi:hypothetical protein E2C01_056316 [Portunus trituberculatus]|uniref:Uncharacterized protein n=1 Tax=Portunus trituberculatus TaxID=210409 RepID=A0A5B7GX20_PORTR|nr:hypothetical protein [Portunus trituberculatus]